MGITYIRGTMVGPTGKDVTLELLVDSGSTYSVVPHGAWQAIDLQAVRRQSFALADGTVVERDVTECEIILPHGRCHSSVVLGQPSDAAILGVLVLEELGLVLNPFTRELQPMRLLLASTRTADDG